jgi:ABC-type nitrate/sulfonate/bicarbonate transport system substrate-binding protein
MMRIAVPDLVSNSYFPAIAAVVLGQFKEQGLDVSLEHISPLDACVRALRDGAVDFIGASAHAPLLAFPEWRGVKLLCAQAQGMYWFLVMRKELGIGRGDLAALKGRRIAAVPFVGMALRRLLIAADLDPDRNDIDIVVPEAARQPGVNFGIAASQALENGAIDGFFANGVGAELAVRRGIGSIVVDVRRGDGPKECFAYTMPAIATTDRLIERAPEAAAGAIRAIVKTQAMLRQDVVHATTVGRALFPPLEAQLIGPVVQRDLPFYHPAITEQFVASMNRYCRDVGLLSGATPYQSVVAAEFRELWNRPEPTGTASAGEGRSVPMG